MGARAALLLALAAAATPGRGDRNVSSLEETGCYLRLETSVGYLESPNYPGDYPAGLECCYDIARPTQGHCGVALHAETFNVMKTPEDGEFCLSDWFVMTSCVPEGGSRQCGNLTGTSFHYLFQPGSRAMRFVFHSSGPPRPGGAPSQRTGYRTGYRLRYRVLTDCAGLYQEATVSQVADGRAQVPCYTRIATKRGSINTPYHPRHYPRNIDCVYEFVRPDPFICGVHMRSTQFHLEPAVWTPLGDACSDYLQAPGCGFMCGQVEVVCECRSAPPPLEFTRLPAEAVRVSVPGQAKPGVSRTWGNVADIARTALYQPGATSQKFHFHSDDANSMPGFIIKYEQLYRC
ncbi:uncharacterized protein LOC134534385 isoform X2 [Bacillus rossius redtenbacheri]|uniref:uncharacterized protein LOC134534385 isoform X2 n=1 Tax=Bacillus rossius redtenbacheri TaxID=93214 RepID=UPI002FDD7A2C